MKTRYPIRHAAVCLAVFALLSLHGFSQARSREDKSIYSPAFAPVWFKCPTHSDRTLEFAEAADDGSMIFHKTNVIEYRQSRLILHIRERRGRTISLSISTETKDKTYTGALSKFKKQSDAVYEQVCKGGMDVMRRYDEILVGNREDLKISNAEIISLKSLPFEDYVN